MQLRKLSVEPLHIPFRVAFQHSSASRSVTETVIVRAETVNEILGTGEGCPRHYVTGETIESAVGFIERNRINFLKIASLADLTGWISDNSEEIDHNPAAFCALELAILDALARTENKSMECLLSLPELSGQFHYSGVLGTSDSKVFHSHLQKYLGMGMKDFKVKLFGDPGIDGTNLDAIRACSRENVRVRFDANNLWKNPGEAADYLRNLNYPVFALEEPLSANDYAGMGEVSRILDSKIIVDESFRGQSDFRQVAPHPGNWIINIRISKMGGILRSLKVAVRARALGVPIIIGAQVGETSVLTRAAITVANACRDILVAQEGAFGTYLLQWDIVDPSIMFGQAGVVEAGQL